jgi:DNA mismatch endonuclease (patch repair protein)
MGILSAAQRSYLMSCIPSRDTKPEMSIRSALHRLGYRFRIHRKDLPGTPDLVFPSRRRIIFVDGCFWHGHGCDIGHMPSSRVRYWKAKINGNRLRDERVRGLLVQQGWQVMTVWECEIKDLKALTKKLVRFLGRR